MSTLSNGTLNINIEAIETGYYRYCDICDEGYEEPPFNNSRICPKCKTKLKKLLGDMEDE